MTEAKLGVGKSDQVSLTEPDFVSFVDGNLGSETRSRDEGRKREVLYAAWRCIGEA